MGSRSSSGATFALILYDSMNGDETEAPVPTSVNDASRYLTAIIPFTFIHFGCQVQVNSPQKANK